MAELVVLGVYALVFPSSQQPADEFVLPPPEVLPFDLPGPFSHRLVKPAAENGWTLKVRYARGPWIHSTQQTYKIVHYISALLIRGDLRVAAIWIADAGKDDSKYTFYNARRSDRLPSMGSEEMMRLIKTPREETT